MLPNCKVRTSGERKKTIVEQYLYGGGCVCVCVYQYVFWQTERAETSQRLTLLPAQSCICGQDRVGSPRGGTARALLSAHRTSRPH